MKHTILSLGGVGIFDPEKLEQFLKDEGFVFIDESYVKKYQEDMAQLCVELRKKGQPEYIMSGKAGNFGYYTDEPLKFEAFWVIKNHGRFQVDRVFLHTAGQNNVLYLLHAKTPQLAQL